jgi:hypothetical protein
MIPEKPQLEQKTSGEIFEDVFNDNSLDNKNKLWISKDSLIKWVKENAKDTTTYSTCCIDDGIIEFKINETTRQGDWSQEEWDDKIKNFTPERIDYEELIKELEKKDD